MSKGNFSKIKGSICNIPVDASKVGKVLPESADSNGLVIVEMKSKLSLKRHVCFKPSSAEARKRALIYLKSNSFPITSCVFLIRDHQSKKYYRV